MITPFHPSPIFPAAAGEPTSPVALPKISAPAQKAQAKAQKRERKHARLNFFLCWCEGCRSYGNTV
jgi:hypothetical protein